MSPWQGPEPSLQAQIDPTKKEMQHPAVNWTTTCSTGAARRTVSAGPTKWIWVSRNHWISMQFRIWRLSKKGSSMPLCEGLARRKWVWIYKTPFEIYEELLGSKQGHQTTRSYWTYPLASEIRVRNLVFGKAQTTEKWAGLRPCIEWNAHSGDQTQPW